MSANTELVLPNQIDRFAIRRCLGKGAQGVVLLGHDEALEREVAIKLMTSSTCAEPALSGIDEGKVAGALRHPNLVFLYECGNFRDLPYLVFEFVNGCALDQLLRDEGKLPLERCMAIFEQLLDAVAYMHGKGLVHRDLKPANILLAENDLAKITDFGVSAAIDNNQDMVHAGTLRYLAPEIFDGEPPRPAVDIYALGLILVEMLSGEKLIGARDIETYQRDLPHLGARLDVLLEQHLDNRSASMLGAVIRKSLHLERNKRFADGNEMRAAWQAALNVGFDNEATGEHHSTIEFLVRRIRNMDSFMAVSAHSSQLLGMVEDDSGASGERIANAVAKDISLSRLVLCTANAVSVGMPEITSVSRAVVVLGLKQLRACLLNALLEQEFVKGTPQLQDQLICSFYTAMLGKELALIARHRALTETYMAGMFCDLGMTLSIHYLPEEFASIERLAAQRGLSQVRSFERVLEVSPHQIGMAIGEMWGLPSLMLSAMTPLAIDELEVPETSAERSILLAKLARELMFLVRDSDDIQARDERLGTLIDAVGPYIELPFDDLEVALNTVADLSAKYARLIGRRIDPANPVARLIQREAKRAV